MLSSPATLGPAPPPRLRALCRGPRSIATPPAWGPALGTNSAWPSRQSPTPETGAPGASVPGLGPLMQDREGATRFLGPGCSGRGGEEHSRRGDDLANVAQTLYSSTGGTRGSARLVSRGRRHLEAEQGCDRHPQSRQPLPRPRRRRPRRDTSCARDAARALPPPAVPLGFAFVFFFF